MDDNSPNSGIASTDHGGAASPRTARKALIDRLDEGGYEWEEVHALIDAVVAQEAPAPEELRAEQLAEGLWETSVRRIEAPWSDAPESERTGTLGWAMAILDYLRVATPPTPAEPPRVTRPLNADSDWTITTPSYRAEARPPEGLDTETLQYALEAVDPVAFARDGTAALSREDVDHFRYAAAIAAEYARLSAGGATKP